MKIFLDTEFIEDGKTIELISIGLAREDGKSYYAELDDCDLSRADEWVSSNVLPHLSGNKISRHVLAQEIIAFVGESPEFWAYYADYDWVALCQIFGRMIDLPPTWPMYCRDLKQWADDLKIQKQEFPPQIGFEHNALADAEWNLRLYNYLRSTTRLDVQS